MAHHKSALKSIRQDQHRTLRNRYHKTTMRTAIKKVRRLLDENKLDEVKQLLPQTYAVIDRCVTKGVIHHNTADRYKSRLTLASAKEQPAETPKKTRA
jgi:small subunit ribosomal protein S20